MTALTKFISEIEERLGAAEEGPWKSREYGGDYVVEQSIYPFESIAVAMEIYPECVIHLKKGNSDLIAHSRTDLELCVAIIKRYEQMVKAHSCCPACEPCPGCNVHDAQSDVNKILEARNG